ncbi:hypothetical protein CLHUN_05730 [Ruminiclostridium hungatei]|uniref:Uncharacterized protein n=1 Tax=Ruminiclostridium hungatei TaxID=48256 RepID=A0A1V4SQ92_RUMHU|nr:hypothetical protein CLHUN_05730 [Ruminiclostridium hungatei]
MCNKRISMLYECFFTDEKGGGLGTIFIGLSFLIIIIFSMLNVVDYSVYTNKRNQISKAMDYAVTAASQQIQPANENIGISNGFSEDSGHITTEQLEIDMDMANRVFVEIFLENVSVPGEDIQGKLLLCTTVAAGDKIRYTMKVKGGQYVYGQVETPADIQYAINAALLNYWTEENKDEVYINGNSKTNMIEKGTYLFAILKNIEISGIFASRAISLSGFAGAKVDRIASNQCSIPVYT